jgi:hypothetical protein
VSDNDIRLWSEAVLNSEKAFGHRYAGEEARDDLVFRGNQLAAALEAEVNARREAEARAGKLASYFTLNHMGEVVLAPGVPLHEVGAAAVDLAALLARDALERR